MKNIISLICLVGVSMFACGCASTIPFKVKHDALKNPPATRGGSLALKPFVDTRAVTNAMQIGGKWKKAKPAYIAGQQRPIADILTDAFREALEKVGYRVQSSPSPNLPALEGEMSEFWLTDDWGGAICKIGVQLRLRQGGSSQALWEKGLKSEEDDWVIIPNAMTAAMNTLLKSAMTEFSSQTFADAVAEGK